MLDLTGKELPSYNSNLLSGLIRVVAFGGRGLIAGRLL
jgi:hypothetical protein